MTSKKKRSTHTANDSWVVIAAESALETEKAHDGDPTFVKLKNPATGSASQYLFSSGDERVYEVKAFAEEFRSWFVGQMVQRDGRLLYVTPVDPVFLVLPYLQSGGVEGKFQPLQQVVMDEDYPGCRRLLKCTQASDSLHHVADEKEVGSQKFHRYNQEKTMEWLKRKVENTVSALKKTDISVGGAVKSTTYVRVKQETDATEEDYLRYAHGLISEYISEELSKGLHKHLQLPEISSPKDVEPPSKPPKKMTAAQKSLAKVDKSGMKSMSAFFSPKVKKEKN
ncbi:ribonuclease H2 subunit B isoform X2 [Salminus brasiliensis]|uniref:ribonuclease H2 subunit B isoform X2 n=1 Tax=Salminus brasiliensis TaxID=930266 RepID=UPI003B8336E4